MRRVALVVHPTRAIDAALAPLTAWAARQGFDVIQVPVPSDGGRSVAPLGRPQDDDLVVALGGDGTVLSALRVAAGTGVPVLGVACGSLGALSAVPAEETATALDRVAAGDWTPRTLPALSVGDGDWAINDVVFIRRGAGQLVVDLTVDGELYVRLAGDGLIVATPLGSSAYSMAAGGPVLAGGTAAFVCTPLAMHGGNAPPLVVPATATARVEAHPGYAGFQVEVDGHERLTEDVRFEVAFHSGKVTLVSFGAPGLGLTGLRARRLVIDSARVLARDARASGA